MRAPKTETSLRKEQILEAALDLIESEGIRSLNIIGIAQRVGFVPSALYRHFKSKEDVLDAMLDLIHDRLLNLVSRVRNESTESLSRLHLLLIMHANMLNENRAIPHVVFSDEFYTGNPGRKARVARIITDYLNEIKKIVEEGKEEGCIRKEIIPETAALQFLGMILPAAVLWNVSEGGFKIEKHINQAWPLYVRSIENNQS